MPACKNNALTLGKLARQLTAILLEILLSKKGGFERDIARYTHGTKKIGKLGKKLCNYIAMQCIDRVIAYGERIQIREKYYKLEKNDIFVLCL